MKPIEKCPFCWGNKIEVAMNEDSGRIICLSCKARGPVASRRDFPSNEKFINYLYHTWNSWPIYMEEFESATNNNP